MNVRYIKKNKEGLQPFLVPLLLIRLKFYFTNTWARNLHIVEEKYFLENSVWPLYNLYFQDYCICFKEQSFEW